VKVNPEGKYVVDVDKEIDIADCKPNTRVALRNDSYTLHKILTTKVEADFSCRKLTLSWVRSTACSARHRRCTPAHAAVVDVAGRK
jgi:hypothetical protein